MTQLPFMLPFLAAALALAYVSAISHRNFAPCRRPLPSRNRDLRPKGR